ncbi:MFS transporter [Pseudomonas putida]|nr:MFS transporter [Pseudomonas putida]KAB5625417.1 MFS transporter [Pseudomonas putida]
MEAAGRFSWARIRPDERAALLLGFVFHFMVLASYYLIRPLRDAIGLEGGAGGLQWLFTATFVVMLLIVPLFGALVSRLPPPRFIPLVYRGVALTMIVFGVLIAARVSPVGVGRAFFVWVSIYNLFTISIFWSVLVDRFSDEQGQRLFGFIAAGGTLGTFAGPILAACLSGALGPLALTLVAALMLEVAVQAYRALLRQTDPFSPARSDRTKPIGGGVLGGAMTVIRSPYLMALVLFMLLHTSAATFLYFEQGRIVASSFTDVASRTSFFATVDLIVSALTLLIQLTLSGPFIRTFGIGVSLAALPLATLAAFTLMALNPIPLSVAFAQVLRRAVEFSIVRPAREVLWTVVSREQKYKAKNFVDTVVYRGGDAASGWVSAGVTALGASFGTLTLTLLPFLGI